jgi:Transposase
VHGDTGQGVGWDRHRQDLSLVCVLDADGVVLLSVKLANDKTEIVAMVATVTGLAAQLVWVVDIVGAPSELVLALLAQAGQSLHYASGRVVAAMSAAYVGEGKTDAKDASVIAETARIRRGSAGFMMRWCGGSGGPLRGWIRRAVPGSRREPRRPGGRSDRPGTAPAARPQ